MLVADDVRDTADTCAVLLRSNGHEACGVYDGRQVLTVAEDFAPDVVILDIGLPNLSGYEVARMLRQRHGDLHPVLIAVTAYAGEEHRVKARVAGFDHHSASRCPSTHCAMCSPG